MPGRDQGVWLYVANTLLRGGVPYRDVWDHKAPLIYFVYASGLILGRGSLWGVWFLEWLSLSAAVYLSFLVARNAFGKLPAQFATVAWVAGLAVVLDGGGSTEEFVLPWQFLGLALYQRIMKEQGGAYGAALLLGLCGSIALLFKENAAGLWVAIAASLALSCASRKNWARLAKTFISMGLGSVPVPVLTVLYFYRTHALNAMWDQAVRFNLVYSHSDLITRLHSIYFNLLVLAPLTFLTWGGWLVGAYLYVFRRRFLPEEAGLLLIVALIALPLETVLASLSGRIYPHYYIVPLPSWSVLIAFAAWYLLQCPLSSRQLLIAIGVIACFWAIDTTRKNCRIFEDTDRTSVLNYVTQHTAPGDYVLMWGAETEINFLAERQAPTKYAYQYPFYMGNYPRTAQVTEFVRDLESHPPTLIIDTGEIGPIEPGFGKSSNEDKQLRLRAAISMSPVLDYVHAHYERVAILGSARWIVYRRRGSVDQERP